MFEVPEAVAQSQPQEGGSSGGTTAGQEAGLECAVSALGGPPASPYPPLWRHQVFPSAPLLVGLLSGGEFKHTSPPSTISGSLGLPLRGPHAGCLGTGCDRPSHPCSAVQKRPAPLVGAQSRVTGPGPQPLLSMGSGSGVGGFLSQDCLAFGSKSWVFESSVRMRT